MVPILQSICQWSDIFYKEDNGNEMVQCQKCDYRRYPERLYKALMNSSTVLTVWNGERLVGLARVLDDTEMLAQIHYVIVHPDMQYEMIKE